MSSLSNPAPWPARGSYADGYGNVARTFARQLELGAELGAGLAVYRRGQLVVDLHGGLADVRTRRPWTERTRVCVFSVTKGLTAMALQLLTDRGELDWDAPVASYWPGFARSGKERITVRTLLQHQGGLAALDTKLTLTDTIEPRGRALVQEAIEVQRPLWRPGEAQGYHALTFGMYARELFERVAGEGLGAFLTRELFEPLGSDARVGTGPEFDEDVATLYPKSVPGLLASTLVTTLASPRGPEAAVAREALSSAGLSRRAFLNPAIDLPGRLAAYNSVEVRRAELAWASATASAKGLARAYLPFASGGAHDGRRYLRAETLEPIYRRGGWSEHDLVLHKPLGWSRGFLKEERHVFSPVAESFGHPGMGGALGWCDPVNELTIGYVPNKMDARVRSPRALALCHALYDSPAIRDDGGSAFASGKGAPRRTTG